MDRVHSSNMTELIAGPYPQSSALLSEQRHQSVSCLSCQQANTIKTQGLNPFFRTTGRGASFPLIFHLPVLHYRRKETETLKLFTTWWGFRNDCVTQVSVFFSRCVHNESECDQSLFYKCVWQLTSLTWTPFNTRTTSHMVYTSCPRAFKNITFLLWDNGAFIQ